MEILYIKLKVRLLNEQFPQLPWCFQRLSAADAPDSVYMWERVNIKCSLTYQSHNMHTHFNEQEEYKIRFQFKTYPFC